MGEDLTGQDLRGQDLSGSNLLAAILTDAQLTDAQLTDAQLLDAWLVGANLTRANLTRANLTRANLTNADLTDAILTNAILTNADLTDSDLTNADLTYAALNKANLTNADLTNADLTYANLTDTNVTGANLTGANLTGVNLGEAMAFGRVLLNTLFLIACLAGGWGVLSFNETLRTVVVIGWSLLLVWLISVGLINVFAGHKLLARADLTGATMPDGTIHGSKSPVIDLDRDQGDANGSATADLVEDAPSSEAVLQLKKCPDCAETVRGAANVCRYCGYRWALPARANAQKVEPPQSGN